MGILSDLVGDVDEFSVEFWGRRPCRARTDVAAVPYSLADVDRLITSALRVPAVRVVHGGRRVPPERWCTPVRIGSTTVRDVADPLKVLDEYRRGATIVLQSLHRTWAPMSAWCGSFEAELGWPVQCNAYLTPPGRTGLDRHADGHDVVIVQIHGSKTWTVDELGAFEVGRGDVMYLPAGIGHAARTTTEPSLHLTVGIHRPSARRLVDDVLDLVDLERSVVPLAPTAPSLGPVIERAVLQAAGVLATEVDGSELSARIRRPARRHLGGLIEAAVRRSPVDDDTTIRVAAGSQIRVDEIGGRLRCAWTAGTLWMPPMLEPALRAMQDAERAQCCLRVGDLPAIEPAARAVLVWRLADEGLLEVVP